MNNLLCAVLLCSISTASYADISSNVSVTSDYVFRGVGASGDSSAVQGGIDYSNGGFGFGLWSSSLGGTTESLDNGTTVSTPTGSELDIFASYTYSFNDYYSLGFTALSYAYSKSPNFDSLEYIISFTVPYMDFTIAHIPGDSFGEETTTTYFGVATSLEIDEESGLALNMSVGSTTYGETEVTKTNNLAYTDYKIGLVRSIEHFDFELWFTDTDRKANTSEEAEFDDATSGVTLIHYF